MYFHPQCRGRRDDERRGAAAVHRKRRAHDGRRGRDEHRAARGHRMSARSRGSRRSGRRRRAARKSSSSTETSAITCPPARRITTKSFTAHSSGPSVGWSRAHGAVAASSRRRPRAPAPCRARPRARPSAHQRAPARHPQHGRVLGRGRAQRREHGAIAAQRDHRGSPGSSSARSATWRSLAPDGRDLDDVPGACPRPGARERYLERRVDRPRRVDDERDARRLRVLVTAGWSSGTRSRRAP